MIGSRLLPRMFRSLKNSKHVRFFSSFIFILLVFGAISCSSPNNLNENVSKEIDSISNYQEYYLKEAYATGYYEVKASEIAVEKAQNVEIKEFAGALVSKNQKIINEIIQMATSRKVKLPAELGQFQQIKITNLKNKFSEEFDKEYIKQMENNQQWTYDFFDKISKESEDNEISTWAIHTLPIIRENLERSRMIKGNLMND